MRPDREIVLHLGLPKTGTTAIQNVFHAHRDMLLEREHVLYPSLSPNLTTPLCSMFQEDPRKHIVNKMAGISTAEEVATLRQKYLEALESEIPFHEWNTLLLSAEGVSNLTSGEITKLRDWGEQYAHRWTVLVCVRHPVAYVGSVIQQIMKGGDTLQQLYEKLPVPNFRGKISNAISVFGRENVRVFDFDTAVDTGGGIITTFAHLAGLTTQTGTFLEANAVYANESLSHDAVHILDSLNRQRPMFIDNVRASRRSGHELPYLSRIKGRRFDLPEMVKDEIRLSTRDDVAWLNRTFALDLYPDIADPAPGRTNGPRDHNDLDAAVVDSLAEIIGELVTESWFHRVLNQAKTANARGDRADALAKLKEAARLNPDAPEPKRLLRKLVGESSPEITANLE